MELPPAGWPGRAEPPALQLRRDPASARRVSQGPVPADELGVGWALGILPAHCSGRRVWAHPARGTP